MLPGLPEEIRPHEVRGLAAMVGLDRLEAQERDVLGRHLQPAEQREGRVGSVGAEVCGDECLPGPITGADLRHVAGAVQRAQAPGDVGHRRHVAEHPQLKHCDER